MKKARRAPDHRGATPPLAASLEMDMDVTHRKKADAEPKKHRRHREDLVRRRTAQLEATQAQLQTVFDVVNIGMLLIDEQGAVQRVNDALSRWVGKELRLRGSVQPGDVIGCVYALVNPSGCGSTNHCPRCALRGAFQSVLNTGRPIHDLETEVAIRVDGKEISLWLEVNADPVVLDGKRHVILAMNNATKRKHAEQKLKALNETLEQRVAERTAVATRRAAQLQGLAAELTRTEHRARRRLAQILHDHLQQLLYAARLSLGALRGGNPEDPQFLETVDQIDAVLGECLAESRALTVQLCPPVLHESGLTMAVEWLARHMEQTCGLEVELDVDPRAEPLSEEIRILLFEAARELLFNVVKHAEVGRARATLSAMPDGNVRLTVSDRGAGFAASDSTREKAGATGFGLFSIRERLELMGGRMAVEAAPGRGTQVTIVAPSQTSAGGGLAKPQAFAAAGASR